MKKLDIERQRYYFEKTHENNKFLEPSMNLLIRGPTGYKNKKTTKI